MTDWDRVKKSLGQKALQLIPKQGMIGLGSGSTAELFIRSLALEHTRHPLNITCLSTSKKSEVMACQLGLPVLPFERWQSEMVDCLVDGADAVDPQGNLIKGLGGALLREKLIAYSSKHYIILVDERKTSPFLQGIVPVEILPQGIPHTIKRIQQCGFHGTLRQDSSGLPYFTDYGNVIFDLEHPKPISRPIDLHLQLKSLVGVVETGLFTEMAPEIIVGRKNTLS